MGAFLWIEKEFVRYPTVPFEILSDVTALVGFWTTFVYVNLASTFAPVQTNECPFLASHGIVVLAAVYYWPVRILTSFARSQLISRI